MRGFYPSFKERSWSLTSVSVVIQSFASVWRCFAGRSGKIAADMGSTCYFNLGCEAILTECSVEDRSSGVPRL